MLNGLQQGVYWHYKGSYYQLLFVAVHSETKELMVVYVPLTGNEGRATLRVRVRPLEGPEGWTTPVEVNGEEQARFVYVGQEVPPPF